MLIVGEKSEKGVFLTQTRSSFAWDSIDSDIGGSSGFKFGASVNLLCSKVISGKTSANFDLLKISRNGCNQSISCSSQNSSNVGVDVALKRRLLSLLVVVVLLSLGRTFDLQRVDGADGVAALGRRDPATRALRRVLAQTDAVVHFAGAADVDIVSVANDVIAVRLPGFRRQLASRDEEEQRGCHEDVPNAEKRQTSSYMKNEHSK